MYLPGIFTGNVISPSLKLRQYGDDYAIHAGRNLPDKEFRYLRTVIVTAVIHQCLASELAQGRLTFWHWTGITFYTSTYVLAESCVFDKQFPPFFRCGPGLHRGGPYPEVTVAILPSSLVISYLDCLSILYLPTSVCSRYEFI